MTIDKDDFAVALRDLADRDPVTAPPTAQVVDRARRARRGRTVAMTAAALAVVTMAGGIGVGLNRGGPAATTATAPTTAAASAPAETPALQLVAAVQASAQTSFRFEVDITGKSVEFGKSKVSRPQHITGAFDPRTPKGIAIRGGGDSRLIGTDLYLQKGKPGPWFKRTDGDSLGLTSVLGTIGLLNPLETVDFVKQFEALKDAGKVTRTSPTTYTFRFTWTTRNEDLPAVVPVAGTIEIDAKSRLVKTMSYDYTYAYPQGPADARFDYKVRWNYSDYGLPVDVPVPSLAPHNPREK
jgi:hypothetical protein